MKLKFVYFSILFLTYIANILSEEKTHLLIKIVANSTEEQLVSAIERYYNKLSKEVPFRFLVICDKNLDVKKIKNKFESYKDLNFIVEEKEATAKFYNGGISDYEKWFDIVLLVDDTLEPIQDSYDKVLVNSFQASFPDYDGVINFSDKEGKEIKMTSAMGKKYYQRFSYVFFPEYKSTACFKEMRSVSRILAKEKVIHQFLLRNPTASEKRIPLSEENLFIRRRANSFGVTEEQLKPIYTKVWSILICTLDERAEQFARLYKKLQQQIEQNNLQNQVEVLFFLDKRGEHTVGSKRNSLIQQSRGAYVNFIDDDDDIHDEYVKMIFNKLSNKPDCVSLVGIITFNGNHPATFIHSIKYKTYFQTDGNYYRPPNHLNPIKRIIACQFLFPTISYGEDTDWAMQIAKTNLLKTEEEIKTPYYFYKYVDKK